MYPKSSVSGNLQWIDFPTGLEGDDDVVNKLAAGLESPYLGASHSQLSGVDGVEDSFSFGLPQTADSSDRKDLGAFFQEVPGDATGGLPENYEANRYSSGLSLVKLSWSFRWHADVNQQAFQGIDGVIVSIAGGSGGNDIPLSSATDFYVPMKLRVKDDGLIASRYCFVGF